MPSSQVIDVCKLAVKTKVYPLYEVSIFLIRRIEKRREADLRAQGLWDEDADTPEGSAEPKA